MLRKCALVFLAPILLASCISAQSIPAGAVETLSGKKLTLPDAFLGHPTVLILGFSRKSKDPTGAWFQRLRREFAGQKDVGVYQVAHLQGAPRFIRGMIVSGMRKGVPQEQQDFLLTVFDNQDVWKQLTNFAAPDDAYVLFCDESGRTVWRTHGPVTDQSVEELKRHINDLRAHS